MENFKGFSLLRQAPGSTLSALLEIADQESWPLCSEDSAGSIMLPEGSAEWLGRQFGIFRLSAIRSMSGVYLFTRRIVDWQKALRWHALYVGETDNMSNRLYDHEKLPEAVGLGVSHIHFHFESDPEKRERIEKELIAYYRPPLNVQGRGL